MKATTTQTQQATEIWNKMNPMERYEKVIQYIDVLKFRGVRGYRKCIKYIIDNNIKYLYDTYYLCLKKVLNPNHLYLIFHDHIYPTSYRLYLFLFINIFNLFYLLNFHH